MLVYKHEHFRKILVFLHLLGMAFLLGGLLTQLNGKQKLLNRGVRDGAYTQIVTGPLLLWVQQSAENAEKINDTVIGIKSLILIAILVIILTNKKSNQLSNAKFYTLLVLAVSAVGFALYLY